MTKHKLDPGQRLIQALVALGRALGYAPVPEWRIPGTSADVDVAWLRDPGDTAPLVAFEVETRPGLGLAGNALKVLGKESSQLPKPLHLFQIVLSGGRRSHRAADVSREFAAHNYSLHLLAD